MDKQKALAVLGITESAGLQEAKAAYRRLAKQHHPDHFAMDARAALGAESRMKDINLAYRFLVPLLPPAPLPGESHPREAPAPESKKGPETAAKPGPTGKHKFSAVFSRFKKQFRKPGRFSRPSSPEKTGPSKWTAKPRQKVRRKPFTRFDQVLEPLSPGATKRSGAANKKAGKKKCGTGRSAPYDNYLQHMALKKTVKARRTRLQDRADSGKVEKITRVRPVNPVGRD